MKYYTNYLELIAYNVGSLLLGGLSIMGHKIIG